MQDELKRVKKDLEAYRAYVDLLRRKNEHIKAKLNSMRAKQEDIDYRAINGKTATETLQEIERAIKYERRPTERGTFMQGFDFAMDKIKEIMERG